MKGYEQESEMEKKAASDETAYLNSISGMLESILVAKKEPLCEASEEPGW